MGRTRKPLSRNRASEVVSRDRTPCPGTRVPEAVPQNLRLPIIPATFVVRFAMLGAMDELAR